MNPIVTGAVHSGQQQPEQDPKPDAAGDHLAAARLAGAECLEAALANLARGWSNLGVCPPDHAAVGKTHAHGCDSPGKAPWGVWKAFQTRLPTEDELRQKWRDNPFLNVGLALGPVSGLVRLDIDGAAGERALREVSGGDVPETLEFNSGREDGSGRGLLYAIPPGVTLKTTPKPGGLEVAGGELRLQGQGAQTVLPPSRHASGRRYRWREGHGPGEIEPALAPAWLVALMRDDRAGGGRGTRGGGRKGAAPPPGGKIKEGKRDDSLASLAGAARRHRAEYPALRALLREHNAVRCDPPLSEAQVDKIARSIAGYPAAEDEAANGTAANGTPFKGTAANGAPSPDDNGESVPPVDPRPAVAIIRDHIRAVYRPSFRRGERLWSSAERGEVRRGEALARCGDSVLMAALLQGALEVLAKKEKDRREALPYVYGKWFPTAWADLMRVLPQEEESDEIDPGAEEDFVRRLSAALTRLVALGVADKEDRDESHRELRSILDWAHQFASKKGYWAQVRSYYVWSRHGRGRDQGTVYVAFRPQLLGQLGLKDLEAMGYERLADLCERYQLGRRCRVGKCAREFAGGWAIELDPAWTDSLRRYPESVPAQKGEA
jgi:hypothetical protein